MGVAFIKQGFYEANTTATRRLLRSWPDSTGLVLICLYLFMNEVNITKLTPQRASSLKLVARSSLWLTIQRQALLQHLLHGGL
jgi:hypothetical protein